MLLKYSAYLKKSQISKTELGLPCVNELYIFGSVLIVQAF